MLRVHCFSLMQTNTEVFFYKYDTWIYLCGTKRFFNSGLFKNRRDTSYDYFFLENNFEKKMNIKGVKLIAI